MRIAVVTTGRQDLGILRSTIDALSTSPDFDLLLWAGGMHSQPRFGTPYSALEREGWPEPRKLNFLAEPPDPVVDASNAMTEMSLALRRDRPETVLLVGDRHETLAIAMATVMEGVPITHLHGGEESEGALDNLFRHAITKLSHLHLVSHEAYAQRVIQMGENPDSVVVVGAPGLDNAFREDLLDRSALEEHFGREITDPLILVTVHPSTSSGDAPLAEAEAVVSAMKDLQGTFVVTLPNADAGGVEIGRFLTDAAQSDDRFLVLALLGDRIYWSMLRQASCVVGNSSSGIIEAPSIQVPSISVGDRQKGRISHPAVLQVSADADSVKTALNKALSEDYRASLRELPPMFPQGPAAPHILDSLRRWSVPTDLIKPFHNA